MIADRLVRNAPCPLCKNDRRSLLYPVDMKFAENLSGLKLPEILSVAECMNCQHQYICPIPTQQFLESFYANYMSVAADGFYCERLSEEIPDMFRKRYASWLFRLRDFHPFATSLFDVGAGLGMFLRLAKDMGWQVSGVEPNQEAVAVLLEKYGIQVENGFLESVIAENRYDVVTMWDLLEHLAEPRMAIEKINQLLNDDGVLVVEVPARDSVIHALVKAAYKISFGMIKRPLFLVYGVHHLQYFSTDSISRLLNESGFDVLEINRGETDIFSLIKKINDSDSISTKLNKYVYNVCIKTAFSIARVIGRQNKLIVFARKRQGEK